MVTRIRKLLEQKQLTPTQFADLIGVGRPVISHILSERNKPSLEVVQRIISAFPALSLPWLLSGIGEMFASEAEKDAVAPVDIATPIEAAPVIPAPPLPASAEPLVALEETASTPTEPPTNMQKSPPVAEPVLIAAPQAVPPLAPAPTPIASPKPFRAATPRGEVAAETSKVLAVAPPTSTSVSVVPPASAPSLAAASAPVAPLASPSPEAPLLPLLAESGKAIRRIVIFYRDGSFADYQPEQ